MDKLEEWVKKSKYNFEHDKDMDVKVIDFRSNETYNIKIGIDDYKIHICTIVDNNMVVYKYFGKKKRWWHYEVVTKFDLTGKVFIK